MKHQYCCHDWWRGDRLCQDVSTTLFLRWKVLYLSVILRSLYWECFYLTYFYCSTSQRGILYFLLHIRLTAVSFVTLVPPWWRTVSSCRLSADATPLLLPADCPSTNRRQAEAGRGRKTPQSGTEVFSLFYCLSGFCRSLCDLQEKSAQKLLTNQVHFLSVWPHPPHPHPLLLCQQLIICLHFDQNS